MSAPNLHAPNLPAPGPQRVSQQGGTVPAQSGTLTRLTLVAPHRRVDLVLPSEASLGTLLPEIVRLLGYRPSTPPQAYRFSLLDGRVVEPSHSLRSAGILDGTLVRIDPISEAPMPAVVHDVTDEVADDLDRRGGRWGAQARRWVATGVSVAAAVWASLLALPELPAAVLPAVGLMVLLAGTGVALAKFRVVGTALLLAGSGIAASGVPVLVSGFALCTGLWAGLLGITVLAVGAANQRLRAGAIGGGTLLGLLALWALFTALRLPWVQVATLLAAVSTVVVGLLPRLALSTSGLTKLDDHQLDSRQVARNSVTAAVDSAHRGLATAAVFASASLALAGWLLAASSNGWALALAGLVAASTALRVRAHPLTIEVVSLTTATAVVAARLIERWIQSAPAFWWAGVLVAVVVIGLALVAMSYRPAAHVRARARQVADRLEGLAVIAMVPVAVGVFGVYSQLLSTF